MNDLTENTNASPEPQPEQGLLYDHPLLEKLDMFDRIVVTAHYGAMVRAAVINSQLILMARILNVITRAVHTSPTFNDDQKTALVGFGAYLNEQMQTLMESAQSTDDA